MEKPKKERYNSENMYNLILICDDKKIILPELSNTSWLKIDILTTDFINKYNLFDFINEHLNLNLNPKKIYLFIYDAKNNKALSSKDVYFKDDRAIIDRELLRDKLKAYLEETDFQEIYFDYNRNIKDTNRLKQIANEILSGSDEKIDILRYNIERLFKKIDRDNHATSKMIRDANKYVKRHELNKKNVLFNQTPKVAEIAKSNELKDKIIKEEQLSMFNPKTK